MTVARIPPRTHDRLRVWPQAGTRARRPCEIANPPATEADASLPRIVASENAQPRRFRRKQRAPPAADAPLDSRPRSSNPHRRVRRTAPKPPRGFLLGRLSGPGPGRSPTVAKGRRPKPFTKAVVPVHAIEF